jgi:hypothetical protein
LLLVPTTFIEERPLRFTITGANIELSHRPDHYEALVRFQQIPNSFYTAVRWTQPQGKTDFKPLHAHRRRPAMYHEKDEGKYGLHQCSAQCTTGLQATTTTMMDNRMRKAQAPHLEDMSEWTGTS